MYKKDIIASGPRQVLLRQTSLGKAKRKKERRQGHMKDALASGGEEGRDKLR